MIGTFIAFEGPEGAGKTTQISLLADHLVAKGMPVRLTREPGGTPEGERLRELLLSPDTDWSPLAEALLMNAARDAHLHQVILPALAAGDIVICDRFSMSTRAYQGGGGGVQDHFLAALEHAVCSRRPDLTLVFDLSPEEGLQRAAQRARADRFESKSQAYHQRVAASFQRLATTEGCCLINASGSVDDVFARVISAIGQRLPFLLKSSSS